MLSMRTCRLSTFDNKFDPLNQFKDWLAEDDRQAEINGRPGALSLLGRYSRTSDELTDEENEAENERAIDEIIKYDFANVFRKLIYIDGKRQQPL